MNLEQLRAYCLSLPAATEEVKWEHNLTFCVGGRMFCITHFEAPFTCSFKVSDEEFEEMSGREGIEPAPYMARAKWVKVSKVSALDKREWAHYLKESYELVKKRLTKRSRQELGIDG